MPIQTSLPTTVSPRISRRPGVRVEAFLPAMAEDVERIGREARHCVIGAVHDEARALGDGAEAADDQPVADERIVVQHALLDEAVRPVRIVVIGEIADLDVLGASTSGFRKPTRVCSGIGCFIAGLGPSMAASFPVRGLAQRAISHAILSYEMA